MELKWLQYSKISHSENLKNLKCIRSRLPTHEGIIQRICSHLLNWSCWVAGEYSDPFHTEQIIQIRQSWQPPGQWPWEGIWTSCLWPRMEAHCGFHRLWEIDKNRGTALCVDCMLKVYQWHCKKKTHGQDWLKCPTHWWELGSVIKLNKIIKYTTYIAVLDWLSSSHLLPFLWA